MKYAIAAAAVVGLVAAIPADNDWEKWSTTTTTASSTEWETWTTTTTTPAAEWTTWKQPEEATCYTTSTYVTKDYEGAKDEWGNYKDCTKTTTIYDDKYCTWEPVSIKSVEWEAVTCSTVSVYVTKDYEGDKDQWGNYKDCTKTTTLYDDKYCPSTWSAVVIKTPEAETTWAPATIKTPEAATTWAPAVIKSSTVSAPVAKWTGAADKQAVGMGALAIAAVAALL